MFNPIGKEKYIVENYKGISIYSGGHTQVPYVVIIKDKTYGHKAIKELKQVIDILHH